MLTCVIITNIRLLEKSVDLQEILIAWLINRQRKKNHYILINYMHSKITLAFKFLSFSAAASKSYEKS
jgi:hypothetical protein